MKKGFYTIKFDGETVSMLDQRLLPGQEVYHKFSNYKDVADAITNMIIRGAPAIGIAAAFGIALGVKGIKTSDKEMFKDQFDGILEEFAETRPTAVNLFWAIERMKRTFYESPFLTLAEIRDELIDKAKRIYEEDIRICKDIGTAGKDLINDGDNVLTHCNAGALATSEYGTALSVIRAAANDGKKIHVFADETRPYLQGARLTAWELSKDSIPVTVICDNMAGYLMSQGKINFIVVGADRIVANGDTANKIGTYSVAVLAKYHKIPFYIAAPLSTIDITIRSGAGIPIEIRKSDEMTHFNGQRIVPEGVPVYNPSFDVTPAELITGIITDRGVLLPPYQKSVSAVMNKHAGE
jgi:methylthioribose-1-phosphate isomerase